jgi:hypothetical protein
VEKIIIFDQNTEGVIKIRFKSAIGAEKAIAVFKN